MPLHGESALTSCMMMRRLKEQLLTGANEAIMALVQTAISTEVRPRQPACSTSFARLHRHSLNIGLNLSVPSEGRTAACESV